MKPVKGWALKRYLAFVTSNKMVDEDIPVIVVEEGLFNKMREALVFLNSERQNIDCQCEHCKGVQQLLSETEVEDGK